MLGRYDMAQADFKTLISLTPESPVGYRNIGFIYLLLGQKDQATRYLTKALELSPHDKKVIEALKNLN